MGRRYVADDYARLVERVRAAIPGVAVHADVIAGFPTEDDEAFDRSVAFIRGLDPAGLHVFRYSARPGTPATRMAGQVAGAHEEGSGPPRCWPSARTPRRRSPAGAWARPRVSSWRPASPTADGSATRRTTSWSR